MNAGFGERLRELRLTAGVSQVELAGDQLSPSYISLLEAGKRQPSNDVVQLLAERLHCTVGDLVDPVTREQAQRAQLEIAYAQLALANGEVDDARRRLQDLLPSILTDRRLTDDARFLLADAFWRDGDHRSAVATLLPVYERAVARTCHLPLTTLSLRLTRYYLDAGDLAAAIRHGENAMRVMSEQGLEETDEFLRAAATLMAAYYAIGDLTHASAWVAALIERAEARGSASGQAALYWNAAAVAESEGKLTEALQLSERALALLSEQGPSNDLGVLYTTCAHFLLELHPSRADRAVDLLERARPLLKDLSSAADLGSWEATRALAALAQDEVVAAEDFARQAVVSLAAQTRPERAEAHLILGDALARQGRQDEANAAYAAAGAVLDTCVTSRVTAAIWRELADRLVRSGQSEAAITAFGRALDSAGVRAPSLPTGAPAGDDPSSRSLSAGRSRPSLPAMTRTRGA